MRSIVAFLVAVCVVQPCWAWSEGGHHLIALLAFDQLKPAQQQAVLDILKVHPRFDQDFKIPEKVRDPERYLIGRAAYWPDVARSQKEYHRSTWHYQLGAVLVLDAIKAPANPGPCPPTATLATQDLYISQAIELCRRVLKDKSQPPADRAVALCWIAHLVGDSHQPCHSGSLYCKLFPTGDRGGNSIPTVQHKNLHALWDNLLGPKFDEGDIRRRCAEFKRLEIEIGVNPHEKNLDPLEWLKDSAIDARTAVYTDQVRMPVIKAGDDGKAIQPIDLTEGYLKNAGITAESNARAAGHRLAEILRQDQAE